MDPIEYKAEFRFEKIDLPSLAEALQTPTPFSANNWSMCDGMEGSCMALKRLSYLCRYSDMIPRFTKPVPVLSMIANTIVDFIYNTHGHRIMQWNNFLLKQLKLEQYAAAFAEKGHHWITAMDLSMVLPICLDLKITKGLCTMATKDYTQSSSSLSLYNME